MLRNTALLSSFAFLAATTATIAHANEQDPFMRAVAAVQERMREIDAQKDRIPGRALVFVKAGEQPIVDVQGIANIESGQPADADTPFYIASMTKAFVGLMAIRLEEMGIMPLDLTLAEAYPTMKVEGVDLSKVTMRHALSHRMGFTSPALSLRTAYTDLAPIGNYAEIVSNSFELTDPSFSYTNSGYLLYAGALEQRTGRSWKSWLDQIVLAPLEMWHSSARTSDLPLSSYTHEIYESRWRTYQPKTDGIMHAAGGMVVSGSDMAKWLAANAREPSMISPSSFRFAQEQQAIVHRAQGPVTCNGYGFGWALCEAAGIRFLEHGGTYTGARSEMVVLPEHGVGFAAMFNSDSMTGGLGMQLFTTFVLAYAGREGELPQPAIFAAEYAKLADRYRTSRSKLEADRPEVSWMPGLAELADYPAIYTHPAYGELEFTMQGSQLNGTFNGTKFQIAPLEKDKFLARLATSNEGTNLQFERNGQGEVVGASWSEVRFARSR